MLFTSVFIASVKVHLKGSGVEQENRIGCVESAMGVLVLLGFRV